MINTWGKEEITKLNYEFRQDGIYDKKTSKKLLTSKKIYDNISELLFERFKKATKNNLKKLLTNMKCFDII